MFITAVENPRPLSLHDSPAATGVLSAVYSHTTNRHVRMYITRELTFDSTKRTICHVTSCSLQDMFINQVKSVMISMFYSS